MPRLPRCTVTVAEHGFLAAGFDHLRSRELFDRIASPAPEPEPAAQQLFPEIPATR
jgi:hypothetical protein